MLQGKLKNAMKLVDEDDYIVGIHELTPEVMTELQRKQPKQESIDEGFILPENNVKVQPVIFEKIDSDTIAKSAKNTHGSGGCTRIDADI